MIRMLSLCFCLCLIVGTVSSASAAQGAWTQKMRELQKILSELLPDITSDALFNAPENRKRIEKNAQKLAELSHGLSGTESKGKEQKAMPPDADPSLPMIADLFDAETRRAATELKRGRREYARSILKTVPGFCIGCHTRSPSGPDLSKMNLTPPQKFAPLEKAEFLAATRQFDPAFDQLEKVIADPRYAQGRQLDWERAVRQALAIAVRVKADPEKALSIVDRVVSSPASPQFLKEDAAKWRESVIQWKDEPKRESATEEGLYAEAIRILTKAREVQKYPLDRSADILYLRLSATVHDLLRQYPNGNHAAEGLLLLGMSYESLRDLELWNLHEMYYASCIQKAPHTPIARNCYRHYEQSMYSGYSGSGGFSLPEDVQKRLSDLKALSEALPQQSP